MAAAFDGLVPVRFKGIAFPVRSVNVRGGLRDHVHEFPHAAGGQPEKLGRKLYEIRMVACFHVTFRQYPDLWPKGITDLFQLFETGETAQLAVPTLGVIFAYCVDWSKDQEARARSGENAEFLFREDASNKNSPYSFTVGSIEKLEADFKKFQVEAEKMKGIGGIGGLVDNITNSVNSVTAIKDQVELQSNLVAANVTKVATLCQQGNATLKIFDQSENHAVKEALHNLWYSAYKLTKDITQRAGTPKTFTTPAMMPVTTIAKSLYGDSSRATDILRMNQIVDPFRVPPNTTLRVPPK